MLISRQLRVRQEVWREREREKRMTIIEAIPAASWTSDDSIESAFQMLTVLTMPEVGSDSLTGQLCGMDGLFPLSLRAVLFVWSITGWATSVWMSLIEWKLGRNGNIVPWCMLNGNCRYQSSWMILTGPYFRWHCVLTVLTAMQGYTWCHHTCTNRYDNSFPPWHAKKKTYRKVRVMSIKHILYTPTQSREEV